MLCHMPTTRTAEAPASTPVGPRIADLTHSSGLKQAYIAQRLGMSRVALNDRLRGRTRWTADELPAIARVLGVHPAELLGDLCTVYRHTDGRLCLQPIDHDGDHFPTSRSEA